MRQCAALYVLISPMEKTARFKHVGLIGKYLQNSADTALQPTQAASGMVSGHVLCKIARCLQDYGCTVALEAQSARGAGLEAQYPALSMEEIASQCDLAVVVGGDGTMLSAARQLAAAQLPLIGINQGRLGFMTDIALEKMQTVLPDMLCGAYTEDFRYLIQAQVLRQGAVVHEAMALNDVVINRGNTSGMLELRLEVDGHFVCNQRADGLIVATSTGSTAYALSAGGALMHPSVASWILVPIAPHTLSNRPIVISENSEIVLEPVAHWRGASVSFDMQSFSELRQGDRVLVRRAPHQARFLHPLHWNYFDTLREKLHWNKGSI